MMLLACSTSVTPGSCTRISFVPCSAMFGSATPSSFTRRSMVCRAWTTESERSWFWMLGFIVKV